MFSTPILATVVVLYRDLLVKLILIQPRDRTQNLVIQTCSPLHQAGEELFTKTNNHEFITQNPP